jgi:DNA-binding CsgD family transcriptional regulator/PAS domain-containing protein
LDATFGDLISSIYDTVIDPTLWAKAIDDIRVAFGFQMAMLGISRLPDGEPFIQASANVPEGYALSIANYGPETLDLWGGAEGVARLPLDEPLLQTRFSKPSDWQGNRFYLEWAKPQGLADQVVILLAQDTAMLGSLSFGRHESAPPVSDAEIEDLRLLTPHIRRALDLTRLMDGARSAASGFEAALNVTSAAVVLVARDMRIVHVNRAAEGMLRDGDPVRSHGGRLQLVHEVAPGSLELAVATAADDEAPHDRRGISIPTRRRSGSPTVVHVMPLRLRSARPGMSWGAAAAIFIAEPSGSASLPVDALAVLFGLTPAELRVFGLLVAGHSNAEIAARMDVAPSTVKTLTLRLFNKTGCHRREALIRLAREVRPPA